MPTDHANLNLLTLAEKYATEDAARAYFEAVRWPNGPECPNGCAAKVYALSGNDTTDKRKRVRLGLYKCAACASTFTVTVGTVMEDSHIPLRKWLLAFYMMAASKTQVSALQLQRQLGIGSYRTALHMCHRIRFALSDVGLEPAKLGGTVEADETWIGGRARGHGRGYVDNKVPVMAVVERDGEVRAAVLDRVNTATVGGVLDTHVAPDAVLNTDESGVYTRHGAKYAEHDTVNHKRGEYVRRDRATGRVATTNAVEGFFGNTKRSLDGTHHSVGRHLALYIGEMAFKYNTRKATDGERTAVLVKRISGRRLTYRGVDVRRRGVVVDAMTPRE